MINFLRCHIDQPQELVEPLGHNNNSFLEQVQPQGPVEPLIANNNHFLDQVQPH